MFFLLCIPDGSTREIKSLVFPFLLSNRPPYLDHDSPFLHHLTLIPLSFIKLCRIFFSPSILCPAYHHHDSTLLFFHSLGHIPLSTIKMCSCTFYHHPIFFLLTTIIIHCFSFPTFLPTSLLPPSGSSSSGGLLAIPSSSLSEIQNQSLTEMRE